MSKTEKKRIRRKLIKFQNDQGKKLGMSIWRDWKTKNGIK